mmetsp:Transcript_16097/g.43604  ORF Transcript_16097/g.43604 Transcript_16097/m.43604 type:complete len:87 (-) Transcript_16097:239-499(-)
MFGLHGNRVLYSCFSEFSLIFGSTDKKRNGVTVDSKHLGFSSFRIANRYSTSIGLSVFFVILAVNIAATDDCVARIGVFSENTAFS